MKGKKHKGPLRNVIKVLRYADGTFDTDTVIFACGHKGHRSNGATRGRCRECGSEEAKRERKDASEG